MPDATASDCRRNSAKWGNTIPAMVTNPDMIRNTARKIIPSIFTVYIVPPYYIMNRVFIPFVHNLTIY
jgi:hypothetical protein